MEGLNVLCCSFQPFVDQAAADRLRYGEEMAQHLSQKPPKRPAGMFALFVKETMSAGKVSI